jgi:hypothetical protein
MLKFREIVLIALAVSAFWIVILVLQSDTAAYGEICEYTQSGQKECTSYHIILVVLWKTSKILNDAWVAVTALATIAIAWFTLILKRSTDNSWRIAQRALTELERPYLFILDYNWLLIAKADGLNSGLVYSIANGGKLPAFIKAVKLGIRFGESIPPLNDDPPVHDLLTAPLLGGGEQRQIIQGIADEGDEPAHECQIRGGTAFIPSSAFRASRVIAKISIEYDGPMTTGHTTTACWEWHPVKYAFTQYGGPEHNQRT